MTIALSPNPFQTGTYFNQTLDVASATLFVYAGGTNRSSAAATLRVWIDANHDTLYGKDPPPPPPPLPPNLTLLSGCVIAITGNLHVHYCLDAPLAAVELPTSLRPVWCCFLAARRFC